MARIITDFNLDFSDIPASGETRGFSISGTSNAEFILEVKDNTTGYYYNFVTKTFQSGVSLLQETITGGVYVNEIAFPSSITTDTVNGAVSSATSVTMDTAVATKMAVGDRVTGNSTLDSGVYTVASIDSTNVFSLSESASIDDGTTLSFAGDDQYDISLYAVPYSEQELSTRHDSYNEVRFGDGSIDINNSTGSDSLMLRKVIYQYAEVQLTLNLYAIIGGTAAGTVTNDTINVSRGKSKGKTAFSIPYVAGSSAAFRILRQPTSRDVLAFIEPVVGSAPITLPGENIYPEVSNTDTTNATMSSTSLVTMTTNVVDKMKVGDRVTGTGISSSDTVTVLNITDGTAKQFRASQNVSISSGVTLSFSNQMNYGWPVTSFADVIDSDMVVVQSSNVVSDTVIRDYVDAERIFAGTKKEKDLIKHRRKAVDKLGKKPTIVKGLVTTQEGAVIFSKQQPLALAGDTLKIGGYGESEILRVYGWDVRFTDLKIELTTTTTTTTETSAGGSSADIAVASREGVINNISRVSGIGINSKLRNPLITSGGGNTGAGDWTMDAAQKLENGSTLTIENTSRTATVTGNIEIIKAGPKSQKLRFDIEKLISTSAS